MTVVINPRRYDAVLFDLDGVVTDTASVHAGAWRRLFDEYLARRAGEGDRNGSPRGFSEEDYHRYLDGVSRYDGVERFLASRGIRLPRGAPGDGEDAETVCGLGNRKDRWLRGELARRGVAVFDTTVALVREIRRAGRGVAVFSASRHCGEVLDAAGLGDLFPVRVDGVAAERLGLAGKPDPAMLLEAARLLGAPPGRCVVVEDAEAGVEAGRRGGFALVIGVDRSDHGRALLRRGADVVVGDLSAVRIDG